MLCKCTVFKACWWEPFSFPWLWVHVNEQCPCFFCPSALFFAHFVTRCFYHGAQKMVSNVWEALGAVEHKLNNSGISQLSCLFFFCYDTVMINLPRPVFFKHSETICVFTQVSLLRTRTKQGRLNSSAFFNGEGEGEGRQTQVKLSLMQT